MAELLSMVGAQRVSLLMSTRNRPLLAADAIRSVLQGSVLPDEIVVVDQSNVPNPGLSALPMPPSVTLRYVRSETVGLSRSRNIAFGMASWPLLVVIDDDCIVANDWLEVLVGALESAGPKAVVTGRVLAGAYEQPGGFAPSLHTSDAAARFRGRITTDPLATFNFGLWADTFTSVGPFDVRLGPGTPFPAAEDNDYGYRLLMLGYAIVFEPAAIVFHSAWRSQDEYVSLRYAYGRGQGGYYCKHLAAGDVFMVRKLASALKRRGQRMLEGGPQAVTGELAWVVGWVVGATTWCLRRLGRRASSVEDEREESLGH